MLYNHCFMCHAFCYTEPGPWQALPMADYEDTDDAERLSVEPSLTLDLDTPEYYKRLQTSNPVE